MAEAAPDQMRLLALDDSLDSAELIVRVATQCGFQAKALVDPSDLQRLLSEWQPQILTLDLCMPKEDGIGVLSQLEQSGFDGHLIIISGQDRWLRKAAARLAEARGLNVANDLSKPVDIKILREYLSELNPVPPASVL